MNQLIAFAHETVIQSMNEYKQNKFNVLKKNVFEHMEQIWLTWECTRLKNVCQIY